LLNSSESICRITNLTCHILFNYPVLKLTKNWDRLCYN
jgi:hypothetical protein